MDPISALIEAGPLAWLAYIGVLIGGVLLGMRGYRTLPQAVTTPDVAMRTIGMEIGNRQQTDELIAEVRRIGDILEAKKQSETDDKLDELLRRVNAREREDARDERERARDIREKNRDIK